MVRTHYMSDTPKAFKNNCFFYTKTFLSVFILIFFLAAPLNGRVTVDPNGVVSPGTTLTIRITLTKGVKSTGLEVIMDENGDGKGQEDEPRWLQPVTVKDGEAGGEFKDHCPKRRIIELHLRLSLAVQEGRYVVRSFAGPGSLPEGAVIHVKKDRIDLFPRIKELIGHIREIITEPPPTLPEVRAFLKEGQIKRADLWLLDVNSKKIISRLTDSGDCFSPSWSPDGRHIVYVRRREDGDCLEKLTFTGKNIKETFSAPSLQKKEGRTRQEILRVEKGEISQPLWSRSGKWIAFFTGDRLLLIDGSGKNRQEIARYAGMEKILAWTRDDRHLIISVNPGADMPVLDRAGNLQIAGQFELPPEDWLIPEIWQVEVKTGQRQRLVFDLTWHWLPYLSPDGGKLVFPARTPAAGYGLWLRWGDHFIKSDSLTPANAADFSPSWSPDNRYIVFVSNREAMQ